MESHGMDVRGGGPRATGDDAKAMTHESIAGSRSVSPAITTQLQPVEFSGTKPAPLSVPRKWKKWLRSLKRVKTPNPWTVH